MQNESLVQGLEIMEFVRTVLRFVSAGENEEKTETNVMMCPPCTDDSSTEWTTKHVMGVEKDVIALRDVLMMFFIHHCSSQSHHSSLITIALYLL